jgi:hypothetical protein
MTSIFWNSDCVDTKIFLRSISLLSPGAMSSLKQNNDLARSATMAALFLSFVDDDDDGAMVTVCAILDAILDLILDVILGYSWFSFLFISTRRLPTGTIQAVCFLLISRCMNEFDDFFFKVSFVAWCSRHLRQIVTANERVYARAWCSTELTFYR